MSESDWAQCPLWIAFRTQVDISRGPSCARKRHMRCSKSRQQLGLAIAAARQAHRKDRALAWLARHCHVAAHHARELAGDGQSEPGAAEALRGGCFGLRKFCEQLRLLFGGHPDAGVGDRDLNPVASIDEPSRLELDLALLGELAGIAQ